VVLGVDPSWNAVIGGSEKAVVSGTLYSTLVMIVEIAAKAGREWN
jgi:hypothetical protein